MFVIIDSNIWISELGLNTDRGAAVRFYIKNRGATVVLPEVIKLETERHLKSELTSYIAELGKNHRQLLSVFGKLKELVLPDASAIEAKVASIFSDCKIELLEIPLTLESARSSFLKTIDKMPPSDKDQQFKDGVIWAECVKLLEKGDVYLVSSDKAFYKGRHYEGGLAEVLLQETRGYKYSIYIFQTLSTLLESIKNEVKVNGEALVSRFWGNSRDSIEGILDRNSFAVTGNPIVSVQLFATEDPNRLYSEFSISYHCEDLTADERSCCILNLKGDCTYLVKEANFEAFRNYGEELLFKTKEGEDQSKRNVVIFANNIVIGHRTVEHSIKYKLDN
jgi:hypothetical protein